MLLKKKSLKPIVKKKKREGTKKLKVTVKPKVSQEQNALGNRVVEQKALENKAKYKREERVKTKANPLEDKAFQSVIAHINISGKSQKKPEDINEKKSQIKKASVLEISEQQKNKSQKSHQSSIEDKSEEVNPKKHEFTSESFKAKFENQLESFKKTLPTNKKSAKNFKNTNHLENLENGIKRDTTSSIESTSAPLTGVVSNEKSMPDDDIISPQNIPEIVLGSIPKPINEKAAIPKIKHSSEISMEKESKSLDETMKENDLTEEQLKNSNEPEFMGALDLKNDAQAKANAVPSRYRTEEQKTLNLAEKESGMLGKQSFEKMVTSRSDNFKGVHKTQTATQKDNVQKRRLINGLFEVIYNGAKIAVGNRLDKITTDTDAFFEKDGKVAKAQKTFSDNVKDRLEGIYGALDETITFLGRITGGKSTAEKAKDIFDDEKEQFVTTLNSAFDDIANLIVKGLNDAISYIATAKSMTEGIYKNLDPDEQKLLADSMESMQSRYTDLEDTVNDKEKELAQGLAKKYKENVNSLQETFDKIEEEVSASFLEKAYDATIGVAKTILKLKNLILDLFSEITPFITTIIKSPVSFVRKLFRGIGDGIELFKENIKKHVLGGFVKWLTGAMGSVSIKIPDDLFSLSGIFSLVMQVLGLGWDYIRKKAVKLLGKPMVEAMEKGAEIFQILRTQGAKGLWAYIKEQFNDLKKTIIEEIQSMLITQVLMAGVKWLVGLLIPGGGFVKAILAIKDLIVFFVETAMMLIPSLISAIKALASGNVKGVAKAVEDGLSKLVVLVISLFAKLIGLGGLSKKVIKIINRVRKRIDRAVDKLILKAKKAFKGLVKKGKGKGKNKSKSKKGKLNKKLGKELKFSAGKEKHKLWVSNTGGKIKVMVASEEGPIEKHLKIWEKKLETVKPKVKAKIAIRLARRLTSETKTEAKEEEIITKAILKDKEITPSEEKKESKAEKETIAKEEKLKKVLMILFDIFGESVDLKEKIEALASKTIIEVISKNQEIWEKYKQGKEKKDKYKSGYTKEEFLKFRKPNIKKAVRPLVPQYLRDRKENPLKEALEAYFIKSLSQKGIKEHTEYKPVIKSIKKKKKKFIISYGYEDLKHKQKSFTVIFDFDKIDDHKDSVQSQTTEGKNLKLKEKGTRGVTESSGKLINKSVLYRQYLKDKKINFKKEFTEKELKQLVDNSTDKKGFEEHFKYKAEKLGLVTLKKSNLFDSAHLVADWFSGSGYKEALNLTVTSAEYNRKTMGDAEKKIASELNKDSIFDLTVTSTWDTLDDSEVLDEVNNISILAQLNANKKIKNIKNKDLAKSAAQELSKILLKNQDPRRVLSVNYSPVITMPKQSSSISKREIGCDVWMSSYFDFDNSNICKNKKN